MSLLLSTLCLMVAFPADPEPTDPKVKPREIVVGKAAPAERAMKTAKITSADDFAKQFGKDAADELAKLVNFKAEYVVVFAWSGSGGDKMEMTTDGKKATFTRKFGLTRDLRQHLKVFALPKDFTYETEKGGR
jgi:hypothetical protein